MVYFINVLVLLTNCMPLFMKLFQETLASSFGNVSKLSETFEAQVNR